MVAAVLTSWVVSGLSASATHPMLAGILTLAISTTLICASFIVLRDPETKLDRKLAIIIFGTFAVIYVTFLVAAAISVAFNPIDYDDRMLSPIYIPLVFVGTLTVDRWLPSTRRRRCARIGLVSMGLFLWLAYLTVINISNIHFSVHHGTDIYTSKRWRDSDLMRAIRQRLTDLPDDRVYSNDRFAVYIHTGLYPAHFSRSRSSLPGPLREMRRTSFIAGDIYLIWWYQPNIPTDYGITELEERYLPDARRVLEVSDGVIYRVNFRERLARDIQKAGEPIIRSIFDVYFDKASLIYMKELCTQKEESSRLFLHVVPVDVSDLPESRKKFGFDKLDFYFDMYGGNVGGGRCLAQVTLPEYPIAKISTGETIPAPGGGWIRAWEGSFDVIETVEDCNARMDR